MRSMKEAATWTTMSALRTPWVACVVREPSRAPAAVSNAPVNAGTAPNTSPVPIDTTSV